MRIRWTGSDKRREKGTKALEAEREESRERICQIRARMEETIQKATNADDLDRKICAADYQILKDELQAEMQHFGSTNRVLGQMRSAELMQTRSKAMERIAEAAAGIDLREMAAQEDEMAIRREILQEEDERYREVMEEDAVQQAFFHEDAEFSCLVAKAKLEQITAKDFPDPRLAIIPD